MVFTVISIKFDTEFEHELEVRSMLIYNNDLHIRNMNI